MLKLLQHLRKYEQKYFFAATIILTIGLPLSNFLMSVSQFILLGVWILTGNISVKLSYYFKNKVAVAISILFWIYVLFIFSSNDLQSALHEIKIKIPLLIFPLVYSYYTLSEKEIIWIFKFFIFSVFAGTLFATGIYLHLLPPYYYKDIREISRFISHIRFSLEIVFAIFLCVYFLSCNVKNYMYLLLGTWFLWYLFISESLTGLIVLLVSTFFFSMILLKRSMANTKYTLFVLVLGLGVFIVPCYIAIQEWRYFRNSNYKEETLKNLTQHGNKYEHDIKNMQKENGNYIWRNICWLELENGWNIKSSNGFFDKDSLGQPQFSTLIRYLTSKNLSKDAEGLEQLTQEDVKNIEFGITNVRFTNISGFRKRIYETFWELDGYVQGIPPHNGSFSQRIEFWKISLKTIKDKLWFGHGTGNILHAMLIHYQSSGLQDAPKFWLKPHNQWLTWGIQFGVLGTVVISLSLAYIMLKTFKKNLLFSCFLMIQLISMLTEDSLDTQAGVTFFGFFITILPRFIKI